MCTCRCSHCLGRDNPYYKARQPQTTGKVTSVLCIVAVLVSLVSLRLWLFPLLVFQQQLLLQDAGNVLMEEETQQSHFLRKPFSHSCLTATFSCLRHEPQMLWTNSKDLQTLHVSGSASPSVFMMKEQGREGSEERPHPTFPDQIKRCWVDLQK